MVDWKTHLKRAASILGSQDRLADAIGCSQAKISWLVVSAKEISIEDALKIERATNGEVAAEQLRPDLAALRAAPEVKLGA